MQKIFDESNDDSEYNNYNFFEKIFGRKGVIMNLLYHGKDLEYKQELAKHFVENNANKEKTKIDLIDLVKKMVDRRYKMRDIENIVDKITNY